MNYNYQELFIAVSIGFLYPFFFSKLMDVIYQRTIIDNYNSSIFNILLQIY